MTRGFTYILLVIALIGSRSLIQAQGDDESWKLLKPKDSTQSIHSTKTPLNNALKRDSSDRPGKVTIHQNDDIDELIRTFNDADKKLNGYRIQIFLGKPKEAQKVRTEFVSKHPDIPVYALWQQPNMKVRAGDLRTRLDAERELKVIKKSYPGAYIVTDEIELPTLEVPDGAVGAN